MMGVLGCKGSGKCASGICPYGVARKNSFDTIAQGYNVIDKVDSGYKVMAGYQKSLVQDVLIASQDRRKGWVGFFDHSGLPNRNMAIAIKDQKWNEPSLREYTDLSYLKNRLRDVASEREIVDLLFGGVKP